MLLISAVLAGSLVLTACHDQDDNHSSAPSPSTPAQAIQQLEREGKLPSLDRSPSIAGPDTNTNGVRDDIDAYLQQRFPDARQRAAAIQMAKAMQGALLADSGNPDASTAASLSIGNAVHCLYSRFPDNAGLNAPAAVAEEVEAITTNTKPRLLAYLAYNKSRDGTTSSSPKGDTCE